MSPGVAGGAKRKVRRTVRVREVMAVADAHRAMPFARAYACQRAFEAVQGADIGLRAIAPRAFCVGHEADAIGTFAVIEPRDAEFAIAMAEDRVQLDVAEWVAAGRTLEGGFERVPAGNFLKRLRHVYFSVQCSVVCIRHAIG